MTDTTTDTRPPWEDDDVEAPESYWGDRIHPSKVKSTTPVVDDFLDVPVVLDRLADEDLRGVVIREATDLVVDTVRARAAARREDRPEKVKHAADVRVELVGAADDADVLAALAGALTAGAKEAKAISADVVGDLPSRDGKPRRSAKVGDGHGYTLGVTVTQPTKLSVDHEAVDDVLVARLAGVVDHEDVGAYAAGARDALAALRGLLSGSPSYRGTALDALVETLGNAGEDDLAKRLRKAYGAKPTGSETITLARKPIKPTTEGDDQ